MRREEGVARRQEEGEDAGRGGGVVGGEGAELEAGEFEECLWNKKRGQSDHDGQARPMAGALVGGILRRS